MKATVNTTNREMVRFISASHNAKALKAHLIFSDWRRPSVCDLRSPVCDLGSQYEWAGGGAPSFRRYNPCSGHPILRALCEGWARHCWYDKLVMPRGL